MSDCATQGYVRCVETGMRRYPWHVVGTPDRAVCGTRIRDPREFVVALPERAMVCARCAKAVADKVTSL